VQVTRPYGEHPTMLYVLVMVREVPHVVDAVEVDVTKMVIPKPVTKLMKFLGQLPAHWSGKPLMSNWTASSTELSKVNKRSPSRLLLISAAAECSTLFNQFQV
jgi:hypothetical protein